MTDRAAFEAAMRAMGWGDYELKWVELEPGEWDYDTAEPREVWAAWQAAVKHERAEFAKVCTDLWHTLCDRDADIGELSVAGDCAHLIRTRGDPPPYGEK